MGQVLAHEKLATMSLVKGGIQQGTPTKYMQRFLKQMRMQIPRPEAADVLIV